MNAIQIPGFGRLILEHLVLDYNGTLAVDGALFTGNGAAMHSTPAIKGIHLAMKSGMLAAETILAAIDSDNYSADTLGAYQQKIDDSWIKKELQATVATTTFTSGKKNWKRMLLSIR